MEEEAEETVALVEIEMTEVGVLDHKCIRPLAQIVETAVKSPLNQLVTNQSIAVIVLATAPTTVQTAVIQEVVILIVMILGPNAFCYLR